MSSAPGTRFQLPESRPDDPDDEDERHDTEDDNGSDGEFQNDSDDEETIPSSSLLPLPSPDITIPALTTNPSRHGGPGKA